MKWILNGLALLALMVTTAVVTFSVTLYAMGGDSENPAAVKIEEIRRYLDVFFIDDYDEAAVLEAAEAAMGDAAAEAMLEATGDEWSHYVSAADYQSAYERSENAYVGIGVTIENETSQGFTVREVAPGGPADLGGVLPGDVLVAVEGKPVLELGKEGTVDCVVGGAGTEVTVTFLRGGETLELTLTRASIVTTVASLEMVDGVGLITIKNFERHAAEQALAAIESALAQDASALIFDVRNDPGGYADEMVAILDRLLPEGILFQSRDYAGREEEERSDAVCVDLPMAVLVNGESYSAAEFFAAALQEYGAAQIVGEQTYGKGNFQYEFPLSDGSAVWLSAGKYYTPNGVSLAGVGITPDIVVELDDEQFYKLYFDQLPLEEDDQIQAALEAVWESP